MNKMFLQPVLFFLISSFTYISNSQTTIDEKNDSVIHNNDSIIHPQPETYFQTYISISPKEATKEIKLRTVAQEWAHENIEGLENIIHKQQLIGVYYAVSLFLERVTHLDSQTDFYNSLLSEKQQNGTLYEKIEFEDRDLKIVFFKDPQSIIDFYPRLAPYKDTTLEEMYNFPYALPIKDLLGFAARKTCLLNIKELSPYPKGDYNGFYYVFANFLHMTALTQEEFSKLEELYKMAKTNDLFLDNFSALSVYSYFAHAVEAYISETKVDYLKNTQDNFISHGHQRIDLQKLDPELYSFIESLIEPY